MLGVEGLVFRESAEIVAGIQGQKHLGFFGRRAMPHHVGHLMHLEILGAGTIRNHMVLVGVVTEVDAITPFREQVDRGRAVQGKILGSDAVFQFRIELAEQNYDIQRAFLTISEPLMKLPEVNEQVTLRESKILRQQAIPAKGSAVYG